MLIRDQFLTYTQTKKILMNNLQFKVAMAGICFAVYPLVLNRSGLTGNISAASSNLILFCYIFDRTYETN